MNGIFHLGPTIGPLFQTYLTNQCSVARQPGLGENWNLSVISQPTLIVKHNCQKTDCDEVEATQTIVGP